MSQQRRTLVCSATWSRTSGEALVRELVVAGVDPKVQRQKRTGTIVILVDTSGERTKFPDRAAAAELADVPGSWTPAPRRITYRRTCLDQNPPSDLRLANGVEADIGCCENSSVPPRWL